MAHTTDAIIVTCMDFRFQKFIEDWANKNVGQGRYDRVAFAGGVLNWPVILSQIELSKKLHHIHKVILINHEDCGGYGEAGTHERHVADLTKAKNDLSTRVPDVAVDLYFAHLDGTFERV